MAVTTNSLVTKARKFGAPVGAAAAVLLAGSFMIGHTAHAASNGVSLGGGAPMDDNSVSSLVALDNAVEAVAARVTPAVVNVAVTSRVTGEEAGDDDSQDSGGQIPQGAIPPEFRKFFGPMGRGQNPQGQIEHGIGSGIIISPDGYIVTNNHVVDGATQVRVTLNDRRVFNAKVVGVDKLNDLAVIKINANNLTTRGMGRLDEAAPGTDGARFRQPIRILPVLSHARHRERARPAKSLHG